MAGYLSVGTAPTRDEVAAAEQLNSDMRAEAQSDRPVHVLCRGRVNRNAL